LRFNDLPIGEIAFVANEHSLDIFPSICVRFNLPHPVADVVKGLLTCAIVGNDDTLDIPEISLCDSSVAFLPSGVPNLQLHIFAVYLDGLDLEIDAYCGDMRDV
jgi:hypothetical protein